MRTGDKIASVQQVNMLMDKNEITMVVIKPTISSCPANELVNAIQTIIRKNQFSMKRDNLPANVIFSIIYCFSLLAHLYVPINLNHIFYH